ncbi:uncharacterized protein LOC107485319 [Arachis duranensis]|uniref:Uncharacterized protein n=2 Tax=Arachis TaxID=3817 RepID=A0A445DEF3_ARAHY|nr:uncharacterized protein LOC107485319 [Arachis duranensis]XP_025695828.1 uncharacterized protein LOC112797220 [Arachis hypogaea]QHO39259.1 uncharacterized protein DS421_4g127540 [Arachis hypogaea]RYR61554.1 hypothetical protein Ahy_A04g018730 [Arachis hypogaea]
MATMFNIIAITSPSLRNFGSLSSSSSSSAPMHTRVVHTKPLQCAPIQQQMVDGTIMCEPCNGKGWLLCDFCKGQKTNVRAENKRLYRRCPTCRAVGYILCSRCKVFKCVTFPNFDDSEE